MSEDIYQEEGGEEDGGIPADMQMERQVIIAEEAVGKVQDLVERLKKQVDVRKVGEATLPQEIIQGEGVCRK